MTSHRERRMVSVPADTLFDLVADVERYPEFLTLWRAARVYAREEGGYFTEQEIGIGLVRERFRTHTRLNRPDFIDISSIDPLFKAFCIRWDFIPIRDGAGADVTVTMTWEVRSLLLQRGNRGDAADDGGAHGDGLRGSSAIDPATYGGLRRSSPARLTRPPPSLCKRVTQPLYLTEHPYGWVAVTAGTLPSLTAVSASFT